MNGACERNQTARDARSRTQHALVAHAHQPAALHSGQIPPAGEVRAEAFTAVASHDRATVQATIMFDSSDKTAARIVSLLGKQVGVLAVEDWTSMASPLEE